MSSEQATRCGFTGGVVVDFPNSTKAKKIFLCLFAGTPVGPSELPRGLGAEDENTIQYSNDRFVTVGYAAQYTIFNTLHYMQYSVVVKISLFWVFL